MAQAHTSVARKLILVLASSITLILAAAAFALSGFLTAKLEEKALQGLQDTNRMVTGMMAEYFAPIVDTEFTASLEDQLDEVEERKVDWHKVLQDFYPPFKKMLETAETAIEKVVIKDEPSDVVCDKCGAQMVYRVGRYGKFLACPNFPECRNTKPVLNYIDAKCPQCGGYMLEKGNKLVCADEQCGYVEAREKKDED